MTQGTGITFFYMDVMTRVLRIAPILMPMCTCPVNNMSCFVHADSDGGGPSSLGAGCSAIRQHRHLVHTPPPHCLRRHYRRQRPGQRHLHLQHNRKVAPTHTEKEMITGQASQGMMMAHFARLTSCPLHSFLLCCLPPSFFLL